MTHVTGYANPDAVISTDQAEELIDDPGVRFVEVDVDTTAYDEEHIPGAVGWDWNEDLQDPLVRDIADKSRFAELLSRSGIDGDTTVLLYGDNHNWFAAYGYWLLKHYGHDDAKLIDGGRARWLDEGRPTSTETPEVERTSYEVQGIRPQVRATRDLVLDTVERRNRPLVDVRSPEEFTGETIAPEGLNETAQRGGHIPGAENVPWKRAVADDGTFKPADELEAIYLDEHGIDADDEVIAYCRIGERSSHTWFVLSELLGLDDARNYDGSWTEYGNLVGVPIER